MPPIPGITNPNHPDYEKNQQETNSRKPNSKKSKKRKNKDHRTHDDDEDEQERLRHSYNHESLGEFVLGPQKKSNASVRSTNTNNSYSASISQSRGVLSNNTNSYAGSPNHSDESHSSENSRSSTLLELVPYREAHRNHPVLDFDEVPLSVLETDDLTSIPEDVSLSLCCIYVQILRIIVPGSANVMVSSYNKKKGTNRKNWYSRLLLCRIVTEAFHEENGRLVYIVVQQRSPIFNELTDVRDKGPLTIGSVLAIQQPKVVEAYMGDENPILDVCTNAILMKLPPYFEEVPENKTSHDSHAFLYNNMKLRIIQSILICTSCGGGNFCDRQRIQDWNHKRGCGCFGQGGRTKNNSSLVFQHLIEVSKGDIKITMSDFSSLQFDRLFLKNSFRGRVTSESITSKREYVGVQKSFKKGVGKLNKNSGVTAVGWYKRGTVNDLSLLEGNLLNNGKPNSNDPNLKVDAGDLNRHIVHILPSDRDFLDKSTSLWKELDDLKYDVSCFV